MSTSCIASLSSKLALCLVWVFMVPWPLAAGEIVFSGNERYSNDELLDIIESECEEYRQGQNLSYIDDAKHKLLHHYRINGHNFATVRYRPENGKITFYIREHRPIVIRKIDIAARGGALSYPTERLRGFLRSAPFFGEHYFVKSQVLEDAAAIDAFYRSEGYLREISEVRHNFVPPAPDATEVEITLVVDEGPRVYLSRVDFEGNLALATPDLSQALGVVEKPVYTPGLHSTLATRLRDFYREKGYAQVKIEPVVTLAEEQPGREERAVLFKIREGKVHRIRSVRIDGNDLTRESFIRERMEIGENDLYALGKIRRSEDNIQRTQLFMMVETREEVVSEDMVDLVVSVVERDSKIASVSLGYSSSYGVVAGCNFEYNNLFGIGRQLHFSGESTIVSPEITRSEGVLELIDPWFWGSPTWSARLKGFVLYEDNDSFELLERGGALIFRKTLSAEISFDLGYELRWSQVLEVEEEIEGTEKGTIFLAQFLQKIVFNFRDDNSYPTSGTYTFFEFEESLTALGAQIDYFKAYGHTAWYFALADRVVLSFSLRGGVIVPFNDTDAIPIQKRFFSGGATTLRSFKEKEMPPWDENDNATGGEGLFLASVELRIPIYADFGISGFADCGEIISTVRESKDYRISHPKYAVGFSVWYNTMVGPIRFDMGFNPDRGENELTGEDEALFAWFISIGFSY